MWKYIRRTLKGLLLLSLLVIIGIALAIGISWLFEAIIVPVFTEDVLKTIFLVVTTIWIIGFLLFCAYSAGEEYERTR